MSTTARFIDPKSSRGTDPLAPEEHPDKIRANNGQGSCRPWVMPYEERNLAHTPQPPLPTTPCQPPHLHTHGRRLLAKGAGGAVGATWCLLFPPARLLSTETAREESEGGGERGERGRRREGREREAHPTVTRCPLSPHLGGTPRIVFCPIIFLPPLLASPEPLLHRPLQSRLFSLHPCPHCHLQLRACSCRCSLLLPCPQPCLSRCAFASPLPHPLAHLPCSAPPPLSPSAEPSLLSPPSPSH